ncbi:MAG: aspartyl protease family protein [Proteobacteria bacterium]|nr:aspartyl protease family protein [Pseudomonadota bacterium]
MAHADDERSDRSLEATDSAAAPPDLDQLLALVDRAAAPVAPPSAPGAGAAPAKAEARDDAPTDLYEAVKPRPKAAPLAAIDPSSPYRSEEELAALRKARRAAWRARLVVLAEYGVLFALVLTAIWLVRSWRTPDALEGRSASVLSTRALSRDRPLRRPEGAGAAARVSPLAGARATGHGAPVEAAEALTGDPAASSSAASSIGAGAGAGAGGAAVRIKIEQRGDAIVVPVVLGGAGGPLATKLVFDTGATFTTLHAATLARLGVPASAVTTETSTASGRVRRALAVIESVAVGAAQVGGGVTVGLCEDCGGAGTAGLLGLNFARHFVVTLDAQQGELVLQPRALRPAAALSEIEPFVAFVETRSERRGALLTIHFSVENRSPRPLRDVVVGAELRGGRGAGFAGVPQARLAEVPAGGRVAARIEAPLVGAADQVATLELRRAAW